MDERTALDALIDAVEAGSLATVSAEHIYRALGRHLQRRFWECYCGSLDAAVALHDALLPAYRFRVDDFRAEVWWGPSGPFIGEAELNPSRAWLLAILRALAATRTDATPPGAAEGRHGE